jgi:outer membrane lipoprotein-sorting protein
LICNFILLFGQQVITAERYLEMVSDHYATIRDYEANIVIRSGNQEMLGNVSYLTPSFLRIDFTRPAEQAIVFNGDTLTVFLPEFRAVLNQDISQNRRSGTAGIATAEGLTLLRRNYVPSFVTGPNPEPLESGSSERVIRLRLTRRTVSEGFREIFLSINPDTMLIRRIEGRTIADGDVRFDFTNIRTNVNIPEQRFIYDNPPLATMHNNFLFSTFD